MGMVSKFHLKHQLQANDSNSGLKYCVREFFKLSPAGKISHLSECLYIAWKGGYCFSFLMLN